MMLSHLHGLGCGLGDGTGAFPGYAGFLDSADCDTIWGWAANQATPNGSIGVDIYDDQTHVVSVTALDLRNDVGGALTASWGVPTHGYHGFKIPTPELFKDGRQHVVRAKFSDIPVELIGSGKTILCGVPVTDPTPVVQVPLPAIQVTSPAVQAQLPASLLLSSVPTEILGFPWYYWAAGAVAALLMLKGK